MEKKSIFRAIAIVSLISLVAHYYDLASGWEIYLSALLSVTGFYFLEHFVKYVDLQKNHQPSESNQPGSSNMNEEGVKEAA